MKAFALIEENLVSVTSDLRTSLVVSNKDKPWCEVIDRVSLPNVYAKYQQSNSRLQELRVKIGKPVVESNDENNSNARWLKWLEKNPNMAVWAEANKKAANEFRKCQPAS